MPSRIVLLAATLLLAVAGCSKPSGVRVENAWVRPVEAGGTTAGYFTLVNDSPDSLVLAAVDAPAAAQSMLHATVRVEGRASMREAGLLGVAPGGRLVFEPGGNHVMLVDAVVALAEGDTTGLTLIFLNGLTLHATAKVRS